MDSYGKCHFLHSGEGSNFFNHCPSFPYPSSSTKNTALLVSSDQVLCKSKQKSRRWFFFCCGKHSRVWPAHLGKSKWLFNTDFILLLPRVRMAGRSVGSQKKMSLPGCASSWVQLSIVEASLFQDVISCFLFTLWFSFCSFSERADHSLVFQEHPLCLVSWEMHFAILSHLWLTFKVYSSLPFHSHSSLGWSLPACGTSSSVPFLSCAKSAKGHFKTFTLCACCVTMICVCWCSLSVITGHSDLCLFNLCW